MFQLITRRLHQAKSVTTGESGKTAAVAFRGEDPVSRGVFSQASIVMGTRTVFPSFAKEIDMLPDRQENPAPSQVTVPGRGGPAGAMGRGVSLFYHAHMRSRVDSGSRGITRNRPAPSGLRKTYATITPDLENKENDREGDEMPSR